MLHEFAAENRLQGTSYSVNVGYTIRKRKRGAREDLASGDRLRHSASVGRCAGIRPDAAAEHRHHLGRRHRPVQHQRLLARRDGLQDAQHRPRREGRHDVHRLLRRAELHRRPGVVHHRAVRPAHRHDQGRPAGGDARAAEGRPDDRRTAQAARATRPGSSARTTSATATSSCPRSTASTSSTATSTT